MDTKDLEVLRFIHENKGADTFDLKSGEDIDRADRLEQEGYLEWFEPDSDAGVWVLTAAGRKAINDVA